MFRTGFLMAVVFGLCLCAGCSKSGTASNTVVRSGSQKITIHLFYRESVQTSQGQEERLEITVPWEESESGEEVLVLDEVTTREYRFKEVVCRVRWTKHMLVVEFHQGDQQIGQHTYEVRGPLTNPFGEESGGFTGRVYVYPKDCEAELQFRAVAG